MLIYVSPNFIGADRTAGHHEAEFDIDEKQLLTGVNIYTKLLQNLSTS
ncbi:hypothetical protein HMPREF9952_1130 [Haemophilus pittmaniae HK 85]|uniref:Uncharacterized protein n=1 Tax=Haemophilus pittmaniae HK 85 TaxID=1035188 RepID=F9Q5J9_9PAST|nr:hypothetical protein HMPREF9952_1130 [Haemophilus pittmaniae HK 85]